MRILIIEDEHYAAKRLENLIKKEIPDAKIVDVLDTVEESVDWFASHVEPNLVFMDIQLADGLSFQIFEKVKVTAPIIFTTAYDEYALNAFKVNSIDYLLKPIEEKALVEAMNKYQQFFPQGPTADLNWKHISKEIFQPKNQYKQRFLIKTGNAYAYLNCTEINLIYSEDGLSFAITTEGKRLLLDESLDKLIKQLEPQRFFKISRKHIVCIDALAKIHPYLNNRLKLELRTPVEDPLIVSREKVREFKTWLDT